jgi:hypothetical protein
MVVLDNSERRMQNEPVQQVRKLAEPAVRRGCHVTVHEYEARQVAALRVGLADATPEGKLLPRPQYPSIDGRQRQLEVPCLVSLQFHVDVAELPQQDRPVVGDTELGLKGKRSLHALGAKRA